MVSLDFLAESRSIAEDAKFVIEDVDAAVLETTFFIVDLRIVVNGIDMLGEGQRPYQKVPLVGFSTWFNRTTNSLAEGQDAHMRLDGGADLRMARTGDILTVTSVASNVCASASVTDFRNASSTFLIRARAFLQVAVPGLQSHPMWNLWFPVGALDGI